MRTPLWEKTFYHFELSNLLNGPIRFLTRDLLLLKYSMNGIFVKRQALSVVNIRNGSRLGFWIFSVKAWSSLPSPNWVTTTVLVLSKYEGICWRIWGKLKFQAVVVDYLHCGYYYDPFWINLEAVLTRHDLISLWGTNIIKLSLL